jgi:hypothetical protein
MDLISIKINELTSPQFSLQDLTVDEANKIVGGKKGGNKHSGYDDDGYGYEGGGVDAFIFDEIGPGNSRRDRFVVSPNGDVFQYNRKGNSKISISYNPGFARR